MLLVCIKVHNFSSKHANDKKCLLYWYVVKQALLNQSENIMRLTDILIFWSIVRVITTVIQREHQKIVDYSKSS